MSRNTDIGVAKDALARGDAAAAEEALGRAVRGGGDDAEALRLRAVARARLGSWGGAADDLEQALSADPAGGAPLEREFARVLRLAQSLEPALALRTVQEFDYEALSAAVSLSAGGRSLDLNAFADRTGALAAEKYGAALPPPIQDYVGARIPGRLYRVPALQALPAMDAWARCEWWALHGLAAADVVHEIATGADARAEEPDASRPAGHRGVEPHVLAQRSPVSWPFVHHALLVLAYHLADDLAVEHDVLRTELHAIRDSVVKPLLFLGFGIGLEAQGV